MNLEIRGVEAAQEAESGGGRLPLPSSATVGGEVSRGVKQQISRVKARLQGRRKQITGAVTAQQT